MQYSLAVLQYSFIPIVNPDVMLILMKHSIGNKFNSSSRAICK